MSYVFKHEGIVQLLVRLVGRDLEREQSLI